MLKPFKVVEITHEAESGRIIRSSHATLESAEDACDNLFEKYQHAVFDVMYREYPEAELTYYPD